MARDVRSDAAVHSDLSRRSVVVRDRGLRTWPDSRAERVGRPPSMGFGFRSRCSVGLSELYHSRRIQYRRLGTLDGVISLASVACGTDFPSERRAWWLVAN